MVDHSALKLNFKTDCGEKGPGYWKINNSVLNEPEYIKVINNTIKHTINECKSLNSKQLTWEMVKINIKECTISYCTSKSLERSISIQNIQKELDQVHEKIVLFKTKPNLDNDDKTELEALQIRNSELLSKQKRYFDFKHKGNQIRARAKWIKYGDIPSKYFLTLEKQRQASNVLTKINQNRRLIKDNRGILKETLRFYESLYKRRNIPQNTINKYLNNFTGTKTLSSNEQKFCENLITKEEIYDVVKNLKLNRSPGTDGLTSEFFQTFWDQLDSLYFEMINETFEKGSLPDSTKKSIITLIFKKGYKTLLKNYRPISLTNCDYKILAFVLARRLQKVIPNLISDDQTGYVKNRYIGISARHIMDIIKYCEDFNKPGAILCLDFKKAFDTLDWKFLFECLRKYNFGDNFIKWIRILYNKPSFSVKNNGWISKEVIMNRGVRQGCAVSALLFILAVEFLATEIKREKNINGITLFHKSSHVIQYADDTTLTLSDKQSVKNSIKMVKNFETVSGLELNIDKCEGMWLGQLKNNSDTFEGILFNNGPIRCLGIYIDKDEDICEIKNWEQKLSDIENIISVWGNRNLSLYGKATIINNAIIPKLIHNMTVIFTPPYVINKLESMIFNFLWGKTHKICKNAVITKIENGGLNITDIESKHSALKASWVTRYINKPEKTTEVLQIYLKAIGIELNTLLKMNFRKIESFDVMSRIPKFYQQVFISYNSCKLIKPVNKMKEIEMFSQPIWGNEYLK